MANVPATMANSTADSGDDPITLAIRRTYQELRNARTVPVADRSAAQQHVQEEARTAEVTDLTGEDDEEDAAASRRLDKTSETNEERDSARRDSPAQSQRSVLLPPLRELQSSPKQPPVLEEESVTSQIHGNDTSEDDANGQDRLDRYLQYVARTLYPDRQASPEEPLEYQRDAAGDSLKAVRKKRGFKITPDSLDPPAEIEDGVVLFTDGSRLATHGAGGTGIAYLSGVRWSARAMALGEIANSLEAELNALREAFRTVPSVLRPSDSRVLMYTDSQEAILLVDNEEAGGVTSTALLQTIAAEKASLRLRGITVEIRWVKGHNVSLGNRLADTLARVGSKQSALDIGSGGGPGGLNKREVVVSEEDLMSLTTRLSKGARGKLGNVSVDPEALREIREIREQRRTQEMATKAQKNLKRLQKKKRKRGRRGNGPNVFTNNL